jgi:hypothetical protein
MSLFNLFGTPTPATAKPVAPGLRIESLEVRDCPSVVPIASGNELSLTLRPNPNALAQQVRVVDTGSARGTNFQVEETTRYRSGPVTVRHTPQGHFAVVKIVGELDRSLGTVTYEPTSALAAGASRRVHFSGNHLGNSFVANVPALSANSRLEINVSGNGGGDRLTTVVRGPLAGGSTLDINMEGNNGWDEVFVDAATYAPRIAGGAKLDVDLAGMSNGYRGTDSDNNVGFGYAGELDGSLLFNLTGGERNDWLGVNLDLRAGSTGRIGNGNVFSARMFGDQGNDTLQYRLYSEVPSPGSLFANRFEGGAYGVYIDGSSGTDTLRLTPGIAYDTCLEYNNEGPIIWVG